MSMSMRTCIGIGTVVDSLTIDSVMMLRTCTCTVDHVCIHIHDRRIAVLLYEVVYNTSAVL